MRKEGGRIGAFVDAVGEVTLFGLRALGALRHVGGFGGEILRQAAIIAAGSALIITLATLLTGVSCAITTADGARTIGVEQIAAVNFNTCGTRQITPFVFGYILAAKVGCGFVAEIGAMRVREEVDALQTIGVRPLPYLVATRFLACTIVLPSLYLLSVASAYAGSFLQTLRYQDVSPGTYEFYFYKFLQPADLIYSLILGSVISMSVILVALYYGWQVSGGPVEVGEATARSMSVNLVLATTITLLGTTIYALGYQLPIA
jgi:phospholipid/cholesterol/gamma-HCH transport system permease protein